MKNLLRTSAALAIVAMAAAFTGCEPEGGNNGRSGTFVSLTWELSRDGTLTIGGRGEMPNWEANQSPPWTRYKDDIRSVITGAGVSRIGSFAFFECKNLTSASLARGLSWIGSNAFRDCPALTEVVIPEGVSIMGSGVFNFCTALESVDLPDGIRTIDNFTFSGCSNLTEADIPNTVTSIGMGVFHSCAKLTSITIPESVTQIQPYAFEKCTGLTSVVIGENVTKIGDFDDVRGLRPAFLDCHALKDVTIMATTPPSIHGDFFETGDTLHVPAGCLEVYRNSPWGEAFTDIVEQS